MCQLCLKLQLHHDDASFLTLPANAGEQGTSRPEE